MPPRGDGVPFAAPWLGEEEAAALARVTASGWVAQGPETAAFESEFAAATGAAHACAVSSGSAALLLALKAAGVGPGDEVITPSYSFIAGANCVLALGARPMFVDINPDTLNLDPSEVEKAIGERTRAVIAVHQLGLPCEVGEIAAIAEKAGVELVEDAACALGARAGAGDDARPIGEPYGRFTCFSFHPRKIITTGEGGMVVSRDAVDDARLRRLRHHGMSISDVERHGSDRVAFEQYLEPGYNCRMSDLQAAIGRVQLTRLGEILAKRTDLAARYNELLSDVPGVHPPATPAGVTHAWQSYCVRLDQPEKREAVMQRLLDAGIATRRGVVCAHRQPAYAGVDWLCPKRERCADHAAGCPNLARSEAAEAGRLLLPLFPTMTEEQQSRVIERLAAALTGT